MLIPTHCSRVSRLGVPSPEPFSGVFSPNITLAENSGMNGSFPGSTPGGPYGIDSVLSLFTRLSKDSAAGRSKSAMWLWSFICCVCTTILMCQCMHVSIRLNRLLGTELGDWRPSNYMGPLSCLKASLRII